MLTEWFPQRDLKLLATVLFADSIFIKGNGEITHNFFLDGPVTDDLAVVAAPRRPRLRPNVLCER